MTFHVCLLALVLLPLLLRANVSVWLDVQGVNNSALYRINNASEKCRIEPTLSCADIVVHGSDITLPATPSDSPIRMLRFEQSVVVDKFWFTDAEQQPVATVNT